MGLVLVQDILLNLDNFSPTNLPYQGLLHTREHTMKGMNIRSVVTSDILLVDHRRPLQKRKYMPRKYNLIPLLFCTY